MPTEDKHTSGRNFVVYEGDRERLSASFIDRSDELLRPEDRFNDEERNTAQDSWLRQGPEHSLRVRRRGERIAQEQAIGYINPTYKQLAETVSLARRVYDSISELTKGIEAELNVHVTESGRSQYFVTFVHEISSSSKVFADEVMTASFDLSTKLIRARDSNEVFVIQIEFAKAQAKSAISHARHVLELNKVLLVQSGRASSGQIARFEKFKAVVDEAETEMKPKTWPPSL